jgi:hypothetical protein
MDQNDRNLLGDSRAVNTIAAKGELTSKPAEGARGNGTRTCLVEQATRWRIPARSQNQQRNSRCAGSGRTGGRCTLPPPSTTCSKHEHGPRWNAPVDAALQSKYTEPAFVDQPSIVQGWGQDRLQGGEARRAGVRTGPRRNLADDCTRRARIPILKNNR